MLASKLISELTLHMGKARGDVEVLIGDDLLEIRELYIDDDPQEGKAIVIS